MSSRRGFTLTELLVVIVLVSALAIALLAVLDPMEQIKRAQDSSTLLLMKGVHGGIANVMMEGNIPWTADLRAVSLTSSEGEPVVDSLIRANEIKQEDLRSNNVKFGNIFMTAPAEGNIFFLCYRPVSKSFAYNKNNRFDQTGTSKAGCPGESCYTCLPNGTAADWEPTGTPGPTIPPYCFGFDPEYPQFGYTCNYSSRWADFGCTNYCVYDWGCGGGPCASNERRLQKNYYGATNPGAITCASHSDQTTEVYCVKGKEANCGYKNYHSYETDYHWGCTSPRRPYEWIQYK